jgi:hypothetical protein
MGIEPTSSAWKAEVLPLNYTRALAPENTHARAAHDAAPPDRQTGGGGRIRTYEGMSQQIYSLPPLAAWVPLRQMSRVFSAPAAVVSTVYGNAGPRSGAPAALPAVVPGPGPARRLG